MSATDTIETIIDGSNIRDSYNPADVRRVYRRSDMGDKTKLRLHFRGSVDSGRFWEFLKAAHDVLVHSDLERRSHAAAHMSQWTLSWIATYGLVEELNTFPRVTDITTDEG